jgi:hypothetical protein
MTVASYERDLAEPGECLFPVVPKIIASTTPATTTPARPEMPPTPQNTRSRNDLQKPLDIPTSFIPIAGISTKCERRNPAIRRARPARSGPFVARDNPCHRYEDGDRRWSRYEPPLSAVDLTEYAGDAVQVGQFGLSEVCDRQPAFGDSLERGSFSPYTNPRERSGSPSAGVCAANRGALVRRHGSWSCDTSWSPMRY